MNGRHAILPISLALLLVLWLPMLAGAGHTAGDVTIDILGADGRRFALHPARSEASDVRRAYLEARYREPYRIRVRNRSARRVGLVIAVDGRNIISGARSELAHDERMYVLGPWESAQYEGWRTSSDRVNEFYFTDWSDSYAEAFGDRTARGVIAVAVYRERHHEPALRQQPEPQVRGEGEEHERDERFADEGAGSAARAPAAAPGPSRRDSADSRARDTAGSLEKKAAASQAGTGYGAEVWSPARIVRFDAQRAPMARHFIKYEWRDTLCRLQLIACERDGEPNRFWDDSFGYAPHPPGRGR